MAEGTVIYTSVRLCHSSDSTQTSASVLSLHELAEVSRIFANGGGISSAAVSRDGRDICE
jgi:hypothetical protein